jgi:acyl dehydratase
MQHTYVRAHPGAMLLEQASGIEDVIEAPHLNSEMARATGMPAAYDFGGQRVSWLAHLVTDWCGDDGFLSELTVDILRPNYLGDTTWIDGAVLGSTRTNDGWRVECRLTATNQRGETTARGIAVVVLPAAARDATG